MLSPTRFTGLAFYHQKENSVSSNLKQKCTFVNLDSWVSVHINVCCSSPFFLLSTLLQRRAMDNRQDLEQRRKCRADLHEENWLIGIIRGCCVFLCVATFLRTVSSLHELHPPLPSLLLGEDKVCMHKCCEYVWEKDMRVWVQGPPSQTQQGAGGGGKRRPGSLPPSLATVEKCSRPRREDRSFLCMYLCE